MAWNPSPRVADCRDIARKWNKKQVIIIAIDENGVMDMATYGETTQLCSVSKTLGDVAYKAMEMFIVKIDSMIEAAEKK